MNSGLLYIGEYKREEEVSMQGVLPTVRVESDFSFPVDLPSSTTWIVRSRRLSLPSYSRLWGIVQDFGSRLCTEPRAYGIISSLRVPSLALADQIPPMLVVGSLTEAVEVKRQAEKRRMQYPLFIRSEVESAAKYVGIEGCTVASPDVNQIESVLGNLRSHVQNFREIAVKEIRPIRRLGKANISIEYRAVGYSGSLVEFDHVQTRELPVPDPSLRQFAIDAFTRLAEAGADGAHAVDVALSKEDQRPFVVEWKDLSSGSLAAPRKVLPMLAQVCGPSLRHR